MTDIFHENIIKKVGEDNSRKIRSANIGIAGAGGLGSNCALNLVRAGFSKLIIVDHDKIDPTNLDRQFFFSDQVGMNKVEALKINLCRIRPGLEIKAVVGRVEKTNIAEFFGGCDCVAECLDSAECKAMLVGELLRLGKFTVTVSGLGGFGSSDDIRIRKVKENLVMIGDLKSDIAARPALSPRVSVAAAKQADVILEHILTPGQPPHPPKG